MEPALSDADELATLYRDAMADLLDRKLPVVKLKHRLKKENVMFWRWMPRCWPTIDDSWKALHADAVRARQEGVGGEGGNRFMRRNVTNSGETRLHLAKTILGSCGGRAAVFSAKSMTTSPLYTLWILSTESCRRSGVMLFRRRCMMSRGEQRRLLRSGPLWR